MAMTLVGQKTLSRKSRRPRMLISVIVPVYKAEKYLSECLDSILDQTYADLEIVLVDDGSPDGSLEICKKYAEKDRRVKIIHQENKGASAARNIGLMNAMGEYVTFVDADDLIDRSMIAVLFHSCEDSNCQAAMTLLQNFVSKTPALNHTNKLPQTQVLTSRDVCKYLFVYQACSPVAKLYRRKDLLGKTFPLNRQAGEDAAFNFFVFCECEKICYVPAKLYFYRQYPASATGSYSLKLLDELKTFQEILSFCEEKKEIDIAKRMRLEYFARLLVHRKLLGKYFPKAVAQRISISVSIGQLRKQIPLSLMERMIFFWGDRFPSLFLKVFFKSYAFIKVWT